MYQACFLPEVSTFCPKYEIMKEITTKYPKMANLNDLDVRTWIF